MAGAISNQWRTVVRAKDRLLSSPVNADNCLLHRCSAISSRLMTMSTFVSIPIARGPFGLSQMIDTNRRYLIGVSKSTPKADLLGYSRRTTTSSSSCSSDLRSPGSSGDGNSSRNNNNNVDDNNTTGHSQLAKRLIPDHEAVSSIVGSSQKYANSNEVIKPTTSKEQQQQQQQQPSGRCGCGIKRTFFHSHLNARESSDNRHQPRVTLFNVSQDQRQQQQQQQQQTSSNQVNSLRPSAPATLVSNDSRRQFRQNLCCSSTLPFANRIESNNQVNSRKLNYNANDSTTTTTTTTTDGGGANGRRNLKLHELARGHQETVKNYDQNLWRIARDYQQTDHYDYSLFGLDAHLDRAVARHQRDAMLYNQDRHLKEEQAKHVAPSTKQSPISIMSMNPTYELQNKPLIIDYPAIVENLRLNNTGFSWEVKMPYQISMTTALHGAHLNTNYRYRLDQFHCHWGDSFDNGSEHTIDARGYSAELHFVHYNMEKYHTFSKAARHSDGLVVLAVFIDANEMYHNHAELEKIVSHLKTVQLKGDRSIIRQAVRIENLLPANRSYWSYQGSLTTPPYFESVTWFILKQPIKCSLSQLQRFRGIKSSLNHDDEFYITTNHRKTQPLNGRSIVMFDEQQYNNSTNNNSPHLRHYQFQQQQASNNSDASLSFK